ncbi:5-hydroxytryptamine receptor-like isoform X2 [Agrilus planipennis]|nr:5-hydroxytryptamine receptor-like isoform X2 [Agrilus planipennis]XP_018335911.1 5-hydroxytryptamine receptor-like isoform X2 [Agrilus planipennis]XP_018335913.1 5-hydroxytryptamine receptor-like isoform X2 [Agrilus planipennis]
MQAKYGAGQTLFEANDNSLLKSSVDPLTAASTGQTLEDLYHYSETTWIDPLSPEDFLGWNCTQGVNASCLGILNSTQGNGTSNTSIFSLMNEDPISDIIVMGLLSILLGLMILVTVIGNVFVIAAILLERNLQNVANYLIVSLAVADLMVACLVMPLGAVYVISNNWIMGPELCDMWTSSDVLCCTASILHLVAIAVDRFWAVTNVDYIHTRNSARIGIMILVVWSVALIVSLAPQVPQFGWKDPDYLYRINVKKQCLVSQDLYYQIFATCSTFYVPLLVILVLYWKIFQTARKRIRRRTEQRKHVESTSSGCKGSKGFLSKRKFLRMKKSSHKKSSATEALMASLVMVEGQSTTTMEVVDELDEETDHSNEKKEKEETTAFTIMKPMDQCSPQNNVIVTVSNNVSPEKSSTATTNNGSASHQSETSKAEISSKDSHLCPKSVNKLTSFRREKKETIEAKRERKAAKTLAIITGAFVMCWLPFFILALLMPLCDKCNISGYVMNFFLWLGYFNSTLNPVIYTIFSPEFRQAFKRILCGGHRRHPRPFRGKVR